MPPADRNNPKRSTASESQYSLMEFMRDFPDDKTCLEWLWNTRYSTGDDTAYCPKCADKTPFKRYETSQQRQSWTCTKCGHHIHPTAGTIFHKSSTSLHLWFYAMYLMSSTRCGISAKQLERELGVTYKTAWRMFHKIRNELMDQDDDELTGEIEIDETYVGGYRKNNKGRRPAEKSTVLGIVERGGKVRAKVVNVTGPNPYVHVEGVITAHIGFRNSTVVTSVLHVIDQEVTKIIEVFEPEFETPTALKFREMERRGRIHPRDPSKDEWTFTLEIEPNE